MSEPTDQDGPEISVVDCDEHGEETLSADGECVLCLNERTEVDHPAIGVAIGLEQVNRGQTATMEDIENALKSNDE